MLDLDSLSLNLPSWSADLRGAGETPAFRGPGALSYKQNRSLQTKRNENDLLARSWERCKGEWESDRTEPRNQVATFAADSGRFFGPGSPWTPLEPQRGTPAAYPGGVDSYGGPLRSKATPRVQHTPDPPAYPSCLDRRGRGRRRGETGAPKSLNH